MGQVLKIAKVYKGTMASSSGIISPGMRSANYLRRGGQIYRKKGLVLGDRVLAINCMRLEDGCEGALKKAMDELAQVPGLSRSL